MDDVAQLLGFARTPPAHLCGISRRGDLIDIQSFIWMQGSDEYEE